MARVEFTSSANYRVHQQCVDAQSTNEKSDKTKRMVPSALVSPFETQPSGNLKNCNIPDVKNRSLTDLKYCTQDRLKGKECMNRKSCVVTSPDGLDEKIPHDSKQRHASVGTDVKTDHPVNASSEPDETDSSTCLQLSHCLLRVPRTNSALVLQHSKTDTTTKYPEHDLSSELGDLESRLDWEKIFRHLSKTIGQNWRLFITCLYGNSKNNIEKVEPRICHTEQTTKSKAGANNTMYIILDQLRAWKEWEGQNIDMSTIYKALEEVEQNDVLHNFQMFMRNPPYIRPSKPAAVITSWKDDRHATSCEVILQSSTAKMIQDSHVSLEDVHTTVQESHLRLERVVDCERECTRTCDYTENSRRTAQTVVSLSANRSTDRHLPACIVNPEINTGQTEIRSTLGPMPKQKSKIKRPTGSNSRKRQRTPRKLTANMLSSDSFLMLAKPYFESTTKSHKVARDMYETLLHISVSKLVKESKLPITTVLTLKYGEYERRQRFETAQEVVYITYIQNTRLSFNSHVCEVLELYVKARRILLRKLQQEENADDTFFVSFDGKAQLNKEMQRQLDNAEDMERSSSEDTTNTPVTERLTAEN